MREIGGYLELECGKSHPYHTGVYLNSGRNALRYIIRSLGIKKLHVPRYTCPVVWQAIGAEGCKIDFYDIDERFFPTQQFGKEDFVLYNNYFGVLGCNVSEMATQYPNLIVDNAQAFYSRQTGRAAFYSPRKFFGLPDGGIAVFKDTSDDKCLSLETDVSVDRMRHLLNRIEFGAEAGYDDFKTSSKMLIGAPVMKMSKLTRALTGNIDVADALAKRRGNFAYIREHLPTSFPIAMAADDVPMVYPYVTDDTSLRARLIKQKIFVASYWPGISECGDLQERILPLPIDQRYNMEDMKRIVNLCLVKEKVFLRPLRVSDAAVSWRWRNDADIWQFTKARPNIVVTEDVEFAWARNVIADKTRINYAICLCPSNRYIGNIYIVNVKGETGELGIFIGDRESHGYGYGRQALLLFKEIVRRDFGIKEIKISVRQDNISALKTYLRCGARVVNRTSNSWLELSIQGGGGNCIFLLAA